MGNNAINEEKILSATSCDDFYREKRQRVMGVSQKKFEFLISVLTLNYFKLSCIFYLKVLLSSFSHMSLRLPEDLLHFEIKC